MKYFRFLFVFIFFLGSLPSLFSQDEILLINGKYIVGDVKGITNNNVFYEQFKNGKFKLKRLSRYDVYQVDFEDSATVVIYEKNESEGLSLEKMDMKKYIMGEMDARKNYKAPMVTVGGLVAGAAGGAGIINPFYGTLIPATYTSVIGIKSAKIKEEMVSNTEMINNRYFKSGYRDRASKIKTKNAIIGSVIGFTIAASLVAFSSN